MKRKDPAIGVVRFERAGAVGHVILCDPPENQLGRRWTDDLRRAVHEVSGSGVGTVKKLGDGDGNGMISCAEAGWESVDGVGAAAGRDGR